MKVLSVNVGRPSLLSWRGQTIKSSIVKRPVDGPVAVRGVNLAGDQQSDLEVHGGPFKAIYGYPSEYYPWWKQQMPSTDFSWGAFGENLTTEGLTDDTAHIGDVYRIGTALLKVTQPRMPCFKLQFLYQREEMVKTFIHGHRHGFYFTIMEEGELQAGDAIEIVERDPNAISIADVIAVYYRRVDDPVLEEKVVKFKGLPAELRLNLAMRAAR